MDKTETRNLMREVSETLLLLMIAALTLAGYVGIALVFVEAIR